MASTGKKGKKTKGKTLALNDFLQENSGAPLSLSIRKPHLNWAEDVEDNCDQYDSRPKPNVILPTAPKASRGFDEFSEKIPHQPPYIAYLSNLPYDVNEEEIAEFFGELKIFNLRIPKDERPGEVPRLKGFGYVEFEDRESLVGALSIPDCTLKNRRIRIEIATNSDNERRRGGRMDNNRDRSDRSEITSGDWRSGPRSDPPPDMERGGRGGGGGGGFSRDRDNGPPQERDRGGGSWRDAARGGDQQESRGFQREGFGDRDRGRFADREGGDRRGGYGSRRNDREDREFTRGSNRSEAPSEPRTRPKLVLAPRSKPVEATASEPEPSNPPPVEPPVNPVPPPSSSSIFGNAKPVDTAARERQIEDKLAKEKTQVVEGRERRRDDWGKRDDEDGKLSRRRESPRRGSPKRYARRDSPEYKRDNSPDRRNGSSNSRKSSLDRKDGRWSPTRGRSPARKASPDGRQSPPYDRKYSPEQKNRSPERKWASPHRRKESPESKWGSSDYRKGSPNRGRDSPSGKRDSPSPRSGSPRRDSPERKYGSSEWRRGSPDRKRSPDRLQSNRGPAKKNDDRDKRGPPRNDKNSKSDKEKSKEKLRDNHDRELPKLKDPEPPSFAVTNKYAFLKAEDSD